ncbi:MAG: DUF1573 domain-containing protein [Myxococcota bacterium]
MATGSRKAPRARATARARAAALLAAALGVAGAARADLAFPETRRDFGELAGAPSPTVEFAFTNTGDAPVTIAKVRTTSPNTEFDWPREPVAPGATGAIPVTVKTRFGGPFRHELLVVVVEDGEERVVETLVVTGRFPDQPLRR